MTTALDDFLPLRTELEQMLGVGLDALDADPVPILASEKRQSEERPLWALRIGDRGLVSAREKWVEPLQAVVEGLVPEELFSILGAYQMARVTLPDGIGIWGPSWYYAGDERNFDPPDDDRPVQLRPEQLATVVDWDIFWHCPQQDAVMGFGIFEEEEVAALATVYPVFEKVWEIGVEVAPQAKGRGLGRAVVGAAGRWILQNGRLVLAVTAPWNVPSARTMRSVGLRYVMTDMSTTTGYLMVPPQPLGQPYSGAELYNCYPVWAMNQHIRPKQ